MQAIEAEAGLENVIVIDHADGLLTIKQKDARLYRRLRVDTHYRSQCRCVLMVTQIRAEYLALGRQAKKYH